MNYFLAFGNEMLKFRASSQCIPVILLLLYCFFQHLQSHRSHTAVVGNGVSLGLPGCLRCMGTLSPTGGPSRKLPPERAAGDAAAEDGLAG